MNSKVLNVKIGEVLYWLFFFSLFFAKGIGLYDGQAVFKLILVFATACLGLKLCMEHYTIGEYLRIIFVIGLTGIAYLNSGEKGLLLYGMMMVGLKYVNVRRLLSISTLVWMAAFLLITVTSLFHMDDTVFKIHDKLGLGHIFRWSLGYPHPNVLHISYVILVMLIIYQMGERFKLKHALWLFVGNAIVFMYSTSYTGFILFVCLLFGRVYLCFRKKLCLLEKGLLWLVAPFCIVLSLVAPVKITGQLFQILNNLLSTRMELAWRYLQPENYSLFGIRVAEITTSRLTMDNSYLFAFITYGMIPFTILCLGILYVVFYYLKKDKYLEILLMITIMVGGMTEPFLFNTSFKNIGFVFGGILLFGSTDVESNKEKRGFSIASKWNKEIALPIGTVAYVRELGRRILAANSRKIITGLFGAALLCLIVQLTVEYPPGYVFYQEDCADINDDIQKLYDVDNPDYMGYKRMGEFTENDVIEYFSGNIVLMEKIRNLVISVVIGYAIGYLICGSYLEAKKCKKRQTGSVHGEK